MVGLPLACLRRGSLASLACFRHAYRGSLSRGQWQQHWQLPVLRAAQNGRLFFSDYKNETDRYNSEEHGLDNGVGNEYNKVGTPPTLEAQSNKDSAPASQLYSNPAWEAMEEAYTFPSSTPERDWEPGLEVTLLGFLGKRHYKRANQTSCDLQTQSSIVRVVSEYEVEEGAAYKTHQDLRVIPTHSPVLVTGTLAPRKGDPPIGDHPHATVPLKPSTRSWYLKLRTIRCLNHFDKSIIVSKDAVWPPHQRHLQMRFDPKLFQRLHLRGYLMHRTREYLRGHGFEEVETPLLFKSTPEGAREFLVPTKRRGYAYALPQSPQQYKQLLMAGGLRQYFQFAKCFRDEDHRADRQPEFTQLDIEASFCSSKFVISHVETLVKYLYRAFDKRFQIDLDNHDCHHPAFDPQHEVQDRDMGGRSRSKEDFNVGRSMLTFADFPAMAYTEAMRAHGNDKPDLRIRLPYTSTIHNVTHIVPQEFVDMITNIEGDRRVDAVRFRFRNPETGDMLRPGESGAFIRKFMDALPKSTLKLSPGSSPGVLIYDSTKPLNGLASLGHEAAEAYSEMGKASSPNFMAWGPLEDGDVMIFVARKPDPWFRTCVDIGRLRTAIHEAAVAAGLIPRPHEFIPLWVRQFPMFTPEEGEGGEPGTGQGGTKGISATHHPFTAPRSKQDLELLRRDPLAAAADHYDLVINGVEVGGGSRRIHVAEVQEYVFREVLGMDDAGIARFSHLLDALRAGCPPHAGFAFGFDRFIAVLCDVATVRDVIAFPKNNKGEDLLVGSPTKYTKEQARHYNLLS